MTYPNAITEDPQPTPAKPAGPPETKTERYARHTRNAAVFVA